ncbi:hypothetical protein [Granulicella arctica]|uniref:hypothetical protein n=1 Tax=Granulicella arctica TaxID=940613 RepID=UPI0021E09953|nr:hypothetical protein [Granulicella arctica]
MNGFEYLALALELWTVVGLLGLTVSLVRREHQKIWQGVGSLVGVWVVYLSVLAVVSHRQPEQRIAMGQPACIHTLCFTVERVEEVPGFPARNHERLLRLTVPVTNRGKSEAQENLRGYLLDAQSRIWALSDAVSGNPLSGRVLAGMTTVSVPVFRLAPDATGLELILRHERWTRWLRHALVIGDPESLGHRPRVMVLDR